MSQCNTCHGKGSLKCPKCKGTGRIRHLLDGGAQCNNCSGSGVVKCGVCAGKGKDLNTCLRNTAPRCTRCDCRQLPAARTGRRRNKTRYTCRFGRNRLKPTGVVDNSSCLRHERTMSREWKRTRPRLLAVVSFRSAVAQAVGPEWCGRASRARR